MAADRQRRLDQLGFIWDPHEQQWEEGFSYLKAFKDREGHCLVQADYEDDSGYKFGKWASHQRRLRNTMSVDRRRRLIEIGFVWDLLERQWEEGFSNLKLFRDREGHCRVAQGFRPKVGSGSELGSATNA